MSDDDHSASDRESTAASRSNREDGVGSDARTDSRVVGGNARAESRVVGTHRVLGVAVDAATRCEHYDSDRDVVAIRFACCDTFYPCHACHDARADHAPERWPTDRFDEPAVLCGACGTTLSVATYLDCDDVCPACSHDFNPGCGAHADRYFDV